MPVIKNVTYTNIITNPTTDDGYTGVLYTWVNNGITNPCTFYTPWFNSYDANDSNAKGYLLENGIYKAKSLWDDILQVGFSSYIGYSGSFVNFEDIGIRTYAQRQSVKQTSTKLYLPVRKQTNVLYYAEDGIEDDLWEWQLQTSSSTVVGSVYSLLGEGTDTAWETSTLYELDGNVFRPTNTKMFGSGGWLDSQGYGEVVYADCRKGSGYIQFSSRIFDTYPRLDRGMEIDVPTMEVTEKLYLPVRKKNGTTQYYT